MNENKEAKVKYIIDHQGIANPVTIYLNIIQNRVVVMCTNSFDQFSITFYTPKECSHDDPLTWMLAHLVIIERGNNESFRESCQAPDDWTCDTCRKSFNLMAVKLKEWMGEKEYRQFLRSPVIR